MRRGRDQQSLSYPLRLPDEVQADALRLLDVSREVINHVVMALWPQLDDFSERGDGPAYKQVEAITAPPVFHGSRLWRCQAEMVGRLLRSQVERKKQFVLILPILEQGMIQPKIEKKRAGKNRKAIRMTLADLRKANDDGGNAVELQSLIEQACNYYLANGCFPDTYEDMQTVPVLKMAQLPYAGDDGASEGQAFRLTIDLDQKQATLAFRFPDEDGKWSRSWRGKTIKLPLPDLVIRRLKSGEALAPTLREVQETDGTRYAVLMVGIRLEWQQPRKTSHTCPACGKVANTYRSPTEREKKQDWGAWLWCDHCGWNGARDYAAALNIARLGAHFIKHYLATGKFFHTSIVDSKVNPVSYMGSGPVLRLPPVVPRSHNLLYAGRIYLNGWKRSVTLHSSYHTEIMLRLCG